MSEKCKECGGEMLSGKAMQQTWTAGMPDFIGESDSRVVTMSAGGPGKLIPCMKCIECGWSVTSTGDDSKITP